MTSQSHCKNECDPTDEAKVFSIRRVWEFLDYLKSLALVNVGVSGRLMECTTDLKGKLTIRLKLFWVLIRL